MHKANNKTAAKRIKAYLLKEGRKNVKIKKSKTGYLVTNGVKGNKKTPSIRKGYWKTPSGNKPKSKYTPKENAVIKKYRTSGTTKTLTPQQRVTLMNASFK